MPLRALMLSLVTVALALLAVGMWVAVVGPMLASTDPVAATAPGAPTPERQLHALTRGVLILSFLLICLLLIVGIGATSREWIRKKPVVRKRVRTRYVDAWKIAGERLEAKDDREGKHP